MMFQAILVSFVNLTRASFRISHMTKIGTPPPNARDKRPLLIGVTKMGEPPLDFSFPLQQIIAEHSLTFQHFVYQIILFNTVYFFVMKLKFQLQISQAPDIVETSLNYHWKGLDLL